MAAASAAVKLIGPGIMSVPLATTVMASGVPAVAPGVICTGARVKLMGRAVPELLSEPLVAQPR